MTINETQHSDGARTSAQAWCTSVQLFSNKECEHLLSLCHDWARGRLKDESVDSEHRHCADCRVNIDRVWLADKLEPAAASVQETLGYRLGELSEPPMVAQYREGEHFDWHVDEKGATGRLVSCTVQLSAPSDYTGGELAILQPDGARTVVASTHRGRATFFASTSLHIVTPVRRGERFALVLWFGRD